ncbi:MAG: indole-3-glycerol-phosphate synthase [Methanomicrobiales archaeon]|nr:indole-3-glycerol-phosphate synthase [Methanomicrobiales archaeon]MDI6875671.1 indole-3-glycerol-phosphate synthase [Methanomicrobiales archaeon]
MILDEIVRRTEARIGGLPEFGETAEGSPRRSLREAILSVQGKNAVIAEIKFASPSAGPLRRPAGVERIARELAAGGCIALSVLTEPFFFRGDPEHLRRARTAVPLPVLRKDFVIDERQLRETAAMQADAVLLIAGLLGDRLPRFADLAFRLGLEPLVEVHTEEEAERALETDAALIGINNRDLRTLEIRLDTTRTLSRIVHREGRLVVSESGFRTPGDLRRMKEYCDAFLIGSSIMASHKPGETLREFVCA